MDAEKKETKEINKMSLLIMAVVVLLLVIAGAVYYIFNQKQQMEELEQAYVLDKESLEDEFNVEIPSEELQNIKTVQDVADYLTSKGVEA